VFKHVRIELALLVCASAAGTALAVAIPPAGATQTTRHVVSVAPLSTITVTIPPFYFDPTDALPETVTKGRTYTVSLRAMASAGTGGGTLSLTAVGGTMSACKVAVKEITPVTVKCNVKVTSPQSLVINATGATKKFPRQSTTFTHAVR
jgi:hypothetical protein